MFILFLILTFGMFSVSTLVSRSVLTGVGMAGFGFILWLLIGLFVLLGTAYDGCNTLDTDDLASGACS